MIRQEQSNKHEVRGRKNVNEFRKNCCDYWLARDGKDNNCVDCRKKIRHG